MEGRSNEKMLLFTQGMGAKLKNAKSKFALNEYIEGFNLNNKTLFMWSKSRITMIDLKDLFENEKEF